jgi:hypothetical protein
MIANTTQIRILALGMRQVGLPGGWVVPGP